MSKLAHHSAHGSRFLHPEGLHHLEDVHYSLRLAPLNGGGYGTEHARAAHRVTAGNTVHSHTRCKHLYILPYSICERSSTHNVGDGEGDREGDGEGDREGDGEGDREGDGEGDREGDGEGDGESDTSSTSPAVDHDGVVASPPLDLAHLINHTGHTGQVGAAAVWGPVGDVELTHLLNSARLQYRSERARVNVISHSSD